MGWGGVGWELGPEADIESGHSLLRPLPAAKEILIIRNFLK